MHHLQVFWGKNQPAHDNISKGENSMGTLLPFPICRGSHTARQSGDGDRSDFNLTGIPFNANNNTQILRSTISTQLFTNSVYRVGTESQGDVTIKRGRG